MIGITIRPPFKKQKSVTEQVNKINKQQPKGFKKPLCNISNRTEAKNRKEWNKRYEDND